MPSTEARGALNRKNQRTFTENPPPKNKHLSEHFSNESRFPKKKTRAPLILLRLLQKPYEPSFFFFFKNNTPKKKNQTPLFAQTSVECTTVLLYAVLRWLVEGVDGWVGGWSGGCGGLRGGLRERRGGGWDGGCGGGWGEELARCLWFLWMCFWLRWVLGQYPGGSVCDVDFNVAART